MNTCKPLCFFAAGYAAAQTTETPVTTDAPDDPSQVFPSVCDVFDAVIASMSPPNVCEANEDCTILDCMLDIYQFGSLDHSLSLVYLPCSQTPTFRVRVVDVLFGSIVYDSLITESLVARPDDLFGTPLNFTVIPLDSGVEFGVSVHVFAMNG